jgi:site-specific DNA recombinase
MRAAIYARYSTDLQRDTSIADQVRSCRAVLEKEHWTLAATYTDAAITGSSRLRPGYQKLLEDARNNQFDVVIAEALDRLSRDQEDVAALFKHLSFANVKLVTIGEGEISELHVGFKGTMNALFLKDLKLKVKRGLEGRVRNGKSAGGLAFGYRVVRQFDTRGELIRGERQINEQEARVVRRIFEEFTAGKSPRMIAKLLNAQAIPGPNGRLWCDTMIRGHRLRGCGVLHNEIYIGRLIWNRQSFIKDPTTGRRVPRYNPETEWIILNVPELRIVEQAMWEKARSRLDDIYSSGAVARARSSEFWKRRRPQHLLTGLVFCRDCGSSYAAAGRHYLACSAARRQGTCNSRAGIPRQALEDLVLNALKRHLLSPEYVKEFIDAFHAEVNRQRRDAEIASAIKRKELDEVQRRLDGLIDAITDGLRAPSLQTRLDQLESRKSELQRELETAPPAAPRFHPRLADVYRDKISQLHGALADPQDREEAIGILRGLIEKISVRPTGRGRSFEVELVGEIANMVALSPGAETVCREPYRSSVKVVAGEGFEPPTLGL